MANGSKVKTKVSNLEWIFIKGDGRNQAKKGQPEKFMFVASAVMKKDGPEHKALKADVDAEWERYKAEKGVKGLPKTTGIKEEMTDDPKGELDPATEKVKKVPTGNVVATFKTNVKWPDGNDQIVKVFDHKGNDITVAYRKVDWGIGKGSLGVIHGTASGNNAGGDDKVSLYLAAVQLSKLVKYEGNEVDADEIDGEDIDLGEDVAAIPTGDQVPAL